MCNVDAEAKKIEYLEHKYLNKFYHLLKYAEDEILDGFETKEKIKADWKDCWAVANKGDFSVGAGLLLFPVRGGHAKVRAKEVYQVYYIPKEGI